MIITETLWDQKAMLIITRISGSAASGDVSEWEKSLLNTLKQLPDNSIFKIMVDLHGFQAINLDVHRQFRTIIPKTLARYDWRVGYLDLFPEACVELKQTRGIRCLAAVHVHHDETKIKNYDENYSRSNERFFTDPKLAREWIEACLISIN